MNKTKKYISILLILIIVCSTTMGCGKNNAVTMKNIEDATLCEIYYGGFWGSACVGYIKNDDLIKIENNVNEKIRIYYPIEENEKSEFTLINISDIDNIKVGYSEEDIIKFIKENS